MLVFLLRKSYGIASAPCLKYVICLGLSTFLSTWSFAQISSKQSSKESDLGLNGIDHVGINITNLQQSADWYKKVLRLSIVHKWTHTWMIGESKFKIGLFERPNGEKVKDIDSTILITHFAILVDSIHFERMQIRLKKLEIPFDPPEDTGIAFAIFIYDPDHHQIEITRYHK